MYLHDYYFYKDLYSNEELKDIRNIIDGNPSSYIADSPAPGKSAIVKVMDTYYFNNALNKFFRASLEVNNKIYGFDIFPLMPSTVHINTYTSENGEYKYHRDAESPGYKNDYKLTVILNISEEPYEGGKFEIFLGQDNNSHVEVLDHPGSILIFPSFLYHRVTPVTSGTRKTISAWIAGPGFK